MILVSGATKTVARIQDPRLGALLRPGNGNRPEGKPWAVDNGAYSGFDADAFRRLLARVRGSPGVLWVAAPDVVADHDATRALFDDWFTELAKWPLAFVAQDGCTSAGVPWDHIRCLFIGGTDFFKWRMSRPLCEEAKARGKWLHVGRVNRRNKIVKAYALGADSMDGTMFSRWSDTHIPQALAHIDTLERNERLVFA